MVALDEEARLRHALWVTRLYGLISRMLISRQMQVARRLQTESRTVGERTRVLRRRSRWLRRTRRPLPQVVSR